MDTKQEITTVALLEPDPEYARMWKHFLESIFASPVIKELQTASELHDLLAVEIPDLILFEYDLPDTKGLFLLSELANDEGVIEIPTIMCSGKLPDTVIIDAYKRGLHSFVNKKSIIARTLQDSISIAHNKVNRMAEAS